MVEAFNNHINIRLVMIGEIVWNCYIIYVIWPIWPWIFVSFLFCLFNRWVQMSSDCWLEMGSCWRSRFIHLYPIMLNCISFGKTPLNAINQLACRWTNNLLLIGFEGKIYKFKDIIMSGHQMFFWTWGQTFYNVHVSQTVTKEAWKNISKR